MGHNAKFCDYTMMHMGSNLITDFELRQSSESTSSTVMERDAAEIVIGRLKTEIGCDRTCTDRSTTVTKRIREKYGSVKHDYDPWHLQMSVGKKFRAVNAQKNVEK